MMAKRAMCGPSTRLNAGVNVTSPKELSPKSPTLNVMPATVASNGAVRMLFGMSA